VGIYVPGGQAAYPSSVLMNAIPARVAGVAEVIMVVPTPNGELNDLVLAAAALSQVDRVFGVGGAQAVAALAYGTDTVPAVDKIVGPGNIYVATAKRLLYGQVGIDMIAGPSEVVVVCDDSVDPDWVAMDMFAQAEHDELAQSIVISSEAPMLAKVKGAIERLLPMMERESVIRTSLARQGALIHVDTLAQAADVVNRIAPEHLELLMREARVFGNKIRHAGAIFVDRYSAESLGDYCAGPNHVLPTSGTARFSSPLGVYDFQKRTSIIQCSEQGASVLARTASVLARCEQLTAHARSAEYRIKQDTLTNRPGDTGVRGKRQK
jgi:histidinol dehydrogenase